MRFLPFVALLAFSAPVIAQEAQPEEKPKEEKKVCRVTTTTGSILGGKRECHTKAEWAQINARGQESAARILDNRRSGNVSAN